MSDYSWQQFLSEMRGAGYEMDEISDKWSEVKEGKAEVSDFLSEGEQGGSETDSGDSDNDSGDDNSSVSGEDSGDGDSSDSSGSDSVSGSGSGSEEVVSFSDAIDSGSEDSDQEGDSSTTDSDKEGDTEASSSELESSGRPSQSDWAESINQGWGMIWASDLEAGTDEWEESTEKVAAIAEQANLGENVSWYVQENFMKSNDDPQSAMVMSLLLACIMTLPQRPEAVKKVKGALKADQKSSSEEEDN